MKTLVKRILPGEINDYGFLKFLRQVNLEGWIIHFLTISLKIISCALTFR